MLMEQKQQLENIMRVHFYFNAGHIKQLQPLFREEIEYRELVKKITEIQTYVAQKTNIISKENVPAYVISTLAKHFDLTIPQFKPMPVAYFKRLQGDNIYNYYKVYGGPGKTRDGYQEVISFLDPKPTIYIDHNYTANDGLSSTWQTFEAGEPINQNEYEEAYARATEGDFTIM
jgi:hypothetical protein